MVGKKKTKKRPAGQGEVSGSSAVIPDLRLQEEGRISPSWNSFSLALVSSKQSSDDLLSFSETTLS